MSSDTPRTDAIVERDKGRSNLKAHNLMLDHARQLERDLISANERADKAEEEDFKSRMLYHEQRERAERAEAERDALLADAERYRYLRQVDRCMEWENLLMVRPITRTEDIDAAIDNETGKHA